MPKKPDVRRGAESNPPDTVNIDRTGFLDAKGVSWSVAWRIVPERSGRIALDFASTTGKRRSAEIQAVHSEELRTMSEQEWRTFLANAAVIEYE